MKNKFIANHQKQDLEKHNIAVGEVARELAELLTSNVKNKQIQKMLIEQACLAGYLHDVGKADPAFQKFINKTIENNNQSTDDLEEEYEWGKKKDKLYHNQISYLCLDANFIANNAAAAYAIYHHHSRHRNSDDFNDNDKVHKDVSSFGQSMIDTFKAKYTLQMPAQLKGQGHEFTTSFPEKTIVTMCLIQADRWVSEIGEELNNADLSNANFCQKFVEFKKSMSAQKRTDISGLYDYQQAALDKIKKSEKSTFVINGPAGCGKTAMSIAFCNNFDRKSDLFVAPRNTICHSLYDTIQNDLSTFNISKTRQLITGNVVQKCSDASCELPMNSDIIIANIDSTLGCYFNHYIFDNLIYYLTQPMVIDEYHELNTGKTAILSVVRNLIAARALLEAKTLLISATPVNILLGLEISSQPAQPIDYEEIKVPFPQDIDTLHHFELFDSVPNKNVQQKNTWIRLNTIGETQSVFQNFDKDGLIIHSKYDKFDREKKMSICNSMYGKNKPQDIIKTNVFSSPVNECSLNNSYDHAILELSTPYSLIQSLGRVLRFKEDNKVGIDSNISLVFQEEDSPSTRAYIDIVYDFGLFKKWKEFIKANFNDKKYKKSEVVNLVENFNTQNKDLIDQWIEANIKGSRNEVKNVKPKSNGRSKYDGGAPILADGTLRGSAGMYCAWHIKDDFYKIFTLSPLDKIFLVKRLNDPNGLGGAGKYKEKIGNKKAFKIKYSEGQGEREEQINLNYPEISEAILFKKARKISSPIFLSINPTLIPDFEPWGFSYDKEEDIVKNLGISKIFNDSNKESENQLIDDDL